MQNLSIKGDGSADIVPAKYSANRKHIAVPQRLVFIGAVVQHGIQMDRIPLSRCLSLISRKIINEVCAGAIGAPLETTGNPHKIAHTQCGAQRITAWTGDLSLNRNRRRIGLIQVFMHENTVPGRQKEIIFRASSFRSFEIHAHDPNRAIGLMMNDLRILGLGIYGEATPKMDRIHYMYPARGSIGAWFPHRSRDCNRGRVFKFVTPKHSDRIERLKYWRGSRLFQYVRQIEAEHLRSISGRRETDDLSIGSGGLGQHIRPG